MPLLDAERTMFPDHLLTDLQVPEGRRWQAIYTKSRQEKALARQFVKDEIPFYLPTIPKQLVIRGRPRQSYIPLFAGYVFVYVNEEERMKTFRHTNRISRYLDVLEGGQLAHDLNRVQRLIEAGAPLTVESRIQVGQRVRIKNGVLNGLEGYVLRRRRQSTLFVAVDFLQQGVSFAIDDYMVEPI